MTRSTIILILLTVLLVLTMGGSYFMAKSLRNEMLQIESAVMADNADAIRAAAAHSLRSINASSKNGVTPLMLAVKNRKKTAVRTLIALGADPNEAARSGENPVTLAYDLVDEDKEYLAILLAAGGHPISE